MKNNLYKDILKTAETIENDVIEFDQPVLTDTPFFRIAQANSDNAPEDAEHGMFYDRSGLFPSREELLVTFSDCEESQGLSTKYDAPNPHRICLAPVKKLGVGFPFMETDDGRFIPGSDERSCEYCPYNRIGRGTPKLPMFDDPEIKDNLCSSFFTWQFLLMENLDDETGTPVLFSYGSSFFMKEYKNLPPVILDGVLYTSWQGLIRQLTKGELLTPDGPVQFKVKQLQRIKLSMRTQKIKVGKFSNYAPIFGIVGIWSDTEHIFTAIRNSREMLPLHNAHQLALDAGDDEPKALTSDHPANAPGDAYDVSQYSAPVEADASMDEDAPLPF